MSILKMLMYLSGGKGIGDLLKPKTGERRIIPSDLDSDALAVLEPSVIVEEDEIKIYFTGIYGSEQNVIYLGTGESANGEWTYTDTPIIGLGYGGAPIDRQAHSSVVFKLGSFYYCFATNGYGMGLEDRNVYLYKSSDGVTFTDLGKVLDKTTILADGFGNTCVYPVLVNGVYELLVDAHKDGIWRVFRFQSTDIESGWTYINPLPSLQVVAGGMYGGMQHFFLNGKWHIFYHYGTAVGNLPTVVGYATSEDLVTVRLVETPMLGIEYPVYGALTDQLADPWIFEYKGKTYMLAEYCKNTGDFESELYMWEYDGTLEQLLR